MCLCVYCTLYFFVRWHLFFFFIALTSTIATAWALRNSPIISGHIALIYQLTTIVNKGRSWFVYFLFIVYNIYFIFSNSKRLSVWTMLTTNLRLLTLPCPLSCVCVCLLFSHFFFLFFLTFFLSFFRRANGPKKRQVQASAGTKAISYERAGSPLAVHSLLLFLNCIFITISCVVSIVERKKVEQQITGRM